SAAAFQSTIRKWESVIRHAHGMRSNISRALLSSSVLASPPLSASPPPYEFSDKRSPCVCVETGRQRDRGALSSRIHPLAFAAKSRQRRCTGQPLLSRGSTRPPWRQRHSVAAPARQWRPAVRALGASEHEVVQVTQLHGEA